MCTKHKQKPEEQHKFLNTVQTKYAKKNWSSCVLFNNTKCKMLTPDYVNKATGLELHQFKWLGDDSLIGDIPLNWNYLADCDTQIEGKPSMIHYTLGGPYFNDYRDCEYATEWLQERDAMLACAQTGEI